MKNFSQLEPSSQTVILENTSYTVYLQEGCLLRRMKLSYFIIFQSKVFIRTIILLTQARIKNNYFSCPALTIIRAGKSQFLMTEPHYFRELLKIVPGNFLSNTLLSFFTLFTIIFDCSSPFVTLVRIFWYSSTASLRKFFFIFWCTAVFVELKVLIENLRPVLNQRKIKCRDIIETALIIRDKQLKCFFPQKLANHTNQRMH